MMANPEERALAKALGATSFAEEGAETSLPVFTAWETSDKHGKLLSAEERAQARGRAQRPQHLG